MSSIGNALKLVRQQKGYSLEDVSKATKISISVLKSIEENNFSALPNGIFTRGFIKSICKFLEIEDEKLLTEYDKYSSNDKSNGAISLPLNFRVTSERLKEQSGKYRIIVAMLIFLILGAILMIVIFTPTKLKGSEAGSGTIESEKIINVEN